MKSKTEILETFADYGFTDKLGHDLLNCQNFLDLVEQATLSEEKKPDTPPSKPDPAFLQPIEVSETFTGK